MLVRIRSFPNFYFFPVTTTGMVVRYLSVEIWINLLHLSKDNDKITDDN